MCSLQSKPGRCYGYFKRFYFNINSGRCEKFIYGGCSGNENNFESKRECENKCGPKQCKFILNKIVHI